jgi:hypothetical protein
MANDSLAGPREGLYDTVAVVDCRSLFPANMEAMSMRAPLRYVQSCTTCGRLLEVRVELLGKPIACPHCHAQFTASAAQRAPLTTPAAADSGDALLERANRVLADADVMLQL